MVLKLTENMIVHCLQHETEIAEELARRERSAQTGCLRESNKEALNYDSYRAALGRLRLCVEALPERERQALRETYGTGDKMAVAAARMGISRNTLGRYRKRGLERLEQLYHAPCTEAQLREKAVQVLFGAEEQSGRCDGMERKIDYSLLARQLAALLEGEPRLLPGLSNAAALLFQSLPEINWAGFYLAVGEELVLGPFQGKPACVRIPRGKGVCGTAWQENRTLVVPDVHAFPGHIACDTASASEIVIPLHVSGAVAGVLDIDSPVRGRFSEEDARGLRLFARVLEEKAVEIGSCNLCDKLL